MYRAVGTFLGASAAVLFVPLFVQDTPTCWWWRSRSGPASCCFLSLHLRTANSYALMLAGYTMPMIALPVVDNPLGVFDVAVSRTEEIFLGIAVAAVVGSMFWAPAPGPGCLSTRRASGSPMPRPTACDSFPVMCRPMKSAPCVRRWWRPSTALELMIGQLPHEGARPQTVRNTKDLRGRMIHLLPVVDALDDALYAMARRTPELVARFEPLLVATREWLESTKKEAPVERWQALRAEIESLQPSPVELDDRRQLLFSNALYRLGEWVDLWQDLRSLQYAIQCESQDSWRAVYPPLAPEPPDTLSRPWPDARFGGFDGAGDHRCLGAVDPARLDRWGQRGDPRGGRLQLFPRAMDDPAPQIYRFFFWTAMSVIFASLYLFVVLPNLHDFPMLVLAFAVPFICVGTLTVQPRFYLGTLLTIVNTSSFISISGAYDADFLNFSNANLAGPVGLLFAFVWTLVARPFGAELAAKRLTRFSWHDIVKLTEPATLAEHRHMGAQMLDRLMQHLPRLAMTGQDTGAALRELRVALNLLDLLAYTPRVLGVANVLLKQVVEEVGEYFRACLKARERLPAPAPLLMTMTARVGP